MPPRFYVPMLASDAAVVDLPKEEAVHLQRVLRLGPGDLVSVFDGRGQEFLARVETTDSGGVTVRPFERVPATAEPAVHLTVAQAMLKGHKMDQVVRDATMLGAAIVQPLTTLRSEVPIDRAKRGARVGRWQHIAVASAKQCGRAVVPQIAAPLTLAEWGDHQGRDRLVLMFVEPGSEAGQSLDILTTRPRPSAAAVVIGPEGGWAPEEIETARCSGFEMFTLGRRVLRADAAAAAVLAVLEFIWKDW